MFRYFVFHYKVFSREGIPHTRPIPQVIRLELFLRAQTVDPKGIIQQPITWRECVPRGWPHLKLTQSKIEKDVGSNIAIRFVGENDYRGISAQAVLAKQ